MKNYVFDGKDTEENQEDADSTADDEGFIDGFMDEEEILECAECGGAVTEEKKITKQIEEEEYTFCSEECAKEFGESVG